MNQRQYRTIAKLTLAYLLATAMAVYIVFALAGCEQSSVRRASIAARDFALATKAFQDAEIVAHQQGFVDDATHRAIQLQLIDVAKAGGELDNSIHVLKSKPKATVAVAQALDATGRLLNEGVLHVKNEQSKQALTAIVLSMRSLLATIAVVTGGVQ